MRFVVRYIVLTLFFSPVLVVAEPTSQFFDSDPYYHFSIDANSKDPEEPRQKNSDKGKTIRQESKKPLDNKPKRVVTEGRLEFQPQKIISNTLPQLNREAPLLHSADQILLLRKNQN